jgi:hypothetical protein
MAELLLDMRLLAELGLDDLDQEPVISLLPAAAALERPASLVSLADRLRGYCRS